MRLLVALLLIMLPVAPAAAQSRPDEACGRAPDFASCARSRAEGLARAYGVPPIETHLEAGDQVLRIFFADGNGQDQLLIAFVRASGREPMAFVHFPRRRGEAEPPMQASLSQATWREAIDQAEYADRRLLAPATPDGAFCLDPWTYVFEASEPRRVGFARPARTRRHIVGSCDEAPLALFASDLQRLALRLFPVCDALDPDHYRNPAAQLLACRTLSGDRLAAAYVMNRASRFATAQGSTDRGALGDLFVYNATVDWNGRRTAATGETNPVAFWLERAAADRVDSFVIEAAEGLTVDRVRIAGHLERGVSGPAGQVRYSAPFEQLWVQEMVVRATVGPWTVQRGN